MNDEQIQVLLKLMGINKESATVMDYMVGAVLPGVLDHLVPLILFVVETEDPPVGLGRPLTCDELSAAALVLETYAAAIRKHVDREEGESA